jgi:hypothetical protein
MHILEDRKVCDQVWWFLLKEPTMDLDLDTFLTIVYCTIDELYQTQFAAAKPRRPGKAPELSDSEILTLTLLAQRHPSRSERMVGRYAATHWRAYFPQLLNQSSFNRRARDLHGVLAALGPAIAAQVAHHLQLRVPYEVLDGIPVPVMARCRGNRHRCFANEVGIGCGGSDRDWYYGVQLLLLVTPAGLITGWTLGSAATEERWVADALLGWRVDPHTPAPSLAELAMPLFGHDHPQRQRRGPTGPIGPTLSTGRGHDAPLLADLGFSGIKWAAHWRQDYTATVVTKAVYDVVVDSGERRGLKRMFNGARQVIKTVGMWLCDRFGLKRPWARSYWGLLTRIAAKVAAFNLGVYVNQLYQRPTFAFFDPFA